MNKFEVYENGGGGILLYLFDGEEVKKVFEGWECGEKGGLLDALNQLAKDPDAWESWDGDLVERLGGRYVIDEIDESGNIIADHFQPFTVEELHREDVDNSDLIAEGEFAEFIVYMRNMGASGHFVFGIDD